MVKTNVTTRAANGAPRRVRGEFDNGIWDFSGILTHTIHTRMCIYTNIAADRRVAHQAVRQIHRQTLIHQRRAKQSQNIAKKIRRRQPRNVTRRLHPLHQHAMMIGAVPPYLPMRVAIRSVISQSQAGYHKISDL
jgi:hypothetical protein